MNLSAEHIEGLATETGFRPETLEKVIRLGEFAADVGRHPLLSRVLALKGGTALNLMFGFPFENEYRLPPMHSQINMKEIS